MEDLLDPSHALVRPAVEPGEERLHLGLPPGVDRFRFHPGKGPGEVRRLEIANQQSVRTKKQGVVGPAMTAQRGQHLGPHLRVTRPIFLEPLGPHLQHETHTLHGSTLLHRFPPSPRLRRTGARFDAACHPNAKTLNQTVNL